MLAFPALVVKNCENLRKGEIEKGRNCEKLRIREIEKSAVIENTSAFEKNKNYFFGGVDKREKCWYTIDVEGKTQKEGTE